MLIVHTLQYKITVTISPLMNNVVEIKIKLQGTYVYKQTMTWKNLSVKKKQTIFVYQPYTLKPQN